ncbi:uncharacterized protein LOC127730931 [Mytilus californianus]|uniref:uncharacterized protein LOC127730931 n=1 Tax=Mytilus californianus TaxID=6549 RepID=UPI0022465C9E|nr:uncharacterized protein LOC127730931 [Mytilus californianus]
MGLNKIEISELSSEQLSQSLIECVKSKDAKNAAALIENGADSNYADEAGCTPLHYAALGGYVDLVVQMIQKGGNVRKVDVNGETAIHKAARKGNIEVIVAIVAHGGDINILNMHGQSGLELAVIRKDASAVRLFCKLGAEAALQDWVWTMGDTNLLAKKDKWILDLLIVQSSRYPGYKYGAISFKVLHVQPGTDDIKMESLGISIQPYGILNSFYLYCCKMHQEYSNARDRLQQQESLFSDVVELVVWGNKPNSLKLQITVPGVPSCSERLSLFPIDGSVNGTIDGFEKIETDDSDVSNYTNVTLTITFGKKDSVMFAIITTEVPETFTVTEEAVCIQPVMEPDAKIDIPQGTFEGLGQLQVNVSETKDLMMNEKGIDEPLLITNVLDLTMSDGKQPKKTVKMQMPVHTQTDTDVIILGCHKEYPEEDDDWEIIETDNLKKFVAFDVKHFSFYVAGSRTFSEKAAKLATQAIKRERRIELFAMVKFETDRVFTLIIECIQKTLGKKRRKQWKEKGFETQSVEYFDCIVQVYQQFKITFSGDLLIQEGTEGTESDKIIIFNPNKKKNHRTFNLVDSHKLASGEVIVDSHKLPSGEEIVDSHKLPSGEVIIDKIIEVESKSHEKEDLNKVPEVMTKPGLFGSCCPKSMYIATGNEDKEQKPQTEYLTTLPIAVKITEVEIPEELFRETKLDPNDPECPIRCTVLRYASLKRLGDSLTDEECHRLGINLNMSVNVLNELMKETNFKENMFQKWRPKRPYESLVESLRKALERIDRQDIGNMVQEAFENESEFRFQSV